MSTPSSPKYSAAMLLAPAHHHHNNNTIKTPKNYDSPKLMAMGISGGGGMSGGSSSINNASTSSSSSNLNSNLIIDNQGQVHDPGYLDALRQLHQQIGQNAIGEKDNSRRRSETKRRTSSMATAGSSHVPSRPSALGLGLTSNEMAKLNLRGGRNGNYSSSSDDDDDDEDEEDWDSYTSLFEDAKKRDAQIHRANSMAAAYTPTGFLNTGSAYNSPRYNNSPLPSTNSYNSNGVSPASTPIFGGNGGGSGHVSPRRDSQSGSTSTAMNGNSVHRPSLAFALNADLEEEMNEAASASGSTKTTSRGRKSDRSTTSSTKSASRRLSLPSHRSNSPPPHSIIAPKATYGVTTMSSVSPLRKDDDWGFTGIVDVERERKQLSNQLGSKIDPYNPSRSNSLFDDEDDDDSLPAPTKSAPDSPSLVAAASLHRSLRTPPLNEKLGSSSTNANGTNSTSRKLRAASFSQNKSKSVTKKPSNSDVASISSNSIRHAGDSSPNHPFLSSKDANSATTPPAAGIQSRKGSLSAIVGNTIRSKSPSLRQKFNYRKGSSRSRPSSSGSAQFQPSSSFQNSHNKSSPTSTFELGGGAERPKEFNAMDSFDRLGGGAGLSTIQSGRLLDGGNHNPNSIQSSLTSDSNIQNNNNNTGGVPNSMPASRTSLSSLSTSARERLGRELQLHQQHQQKQPQQQSSSSNIDSSSSIKADGGAEDRNIPEDFAQVYQIDGLENGTGTTSAGGITKKAHDLGEYASQQSHDLRRKMDIFTMGLRFNAFKAKRKFERGFKHNET